MTEDTEQLGTQVIVLTKAVGDLTHQMALDALRRESGDRELHTIVESTLQFLRELKTDLAEWKETIAGLPDSLPAMRGLAHAVEANTRKLEALGKTADLAHAKASRNDTIITTSIGGGILSFIGLVFALARSGAF